ncbi:hypothetical protein LMG29542_08083 [Paraburkholderia humisilvae]|uniref:Uncharacterized protein n=1 Tax=Paraburkholderia humisilvae TaxID=627669 RepID=A0A6J5FBW0_9BURK|nr:hypothetical protein LMG29542_08083 [Paraburkholderia humisilvae]
MDSCSTFTASFAFTPSATFDSFTGAVVPAPPSVTCDFDASSYITAFASPVESEETPVESDVMPVESEATPVESDDTLVTTVVDSASRLALVAFSAVSVAYSCEPLTASVLVPSTWPGATLVICRSAPAAPTLTTPLALPAYVYAVPAIVSPVTGTAAVAACEPAPSAMELSAPADAPWPMAIAFVPVAPSLL